MRHKYATPWIWIFLLALALDNETTGANTAHLALFLLVLPSIAAGLALLLIAPRFHAPSRLRSVVTISTLLCVFGSILAQLVQGNDTGNYLRTLLPFVLFMVGYLVACRPWSEYRLTQFEKALFLANVISLVFTFVYGMAAAGGFDEMRLRIVSVTLLGLQGVLLHEFVVARRFSRYTVAVFAATVVVELLSESRNLLIGTALLFLLALALSAPTRRRIRRMLARGLVVGAMLGGIGGIVAWSFPEFAQQWTQHIFGSGEAAAGQDPSTMTRLAEMRSQYDQVTSSAGTLLFGEGYGHDYRYSPVNRPDLADRSNGEEFLVVHEWAAGHNFWVYQLFAGGLVFGVGMPVAMLAALAICCFSYRYWRAVVPDAPLLPVLGRAIMLFAALPATSIGSNPLGPRFSGLVFGVALGLMIATHARLHLALPARAKRPARPPHLHPAAMPDLPGRVHPGMGHADLAATLDMSGPAGAPSESQPPLGALVPLNSPAPPANRPTIVR